MVYVEYCDKCGNEISPWDNEYGQVMSVFVEIDVGDSRELCDGKAHFCSPTCAIEYLKKHKEEEDHWIDVWKRGKILGVAPVKPKKINRSNMY